MFSWHTSPETKISKMGSMRESGYYFLNINMKQNIVNSSTRSIYYNSNMAPRLFGHIYIFGLVFFRNFFGNLRNNGVVKNLQ